MLQDILDNCEASIQAIRDEAKQALADAPITDEYLEHTKQWAFSRDRYVIIRPDGKQANGFPFGFSQTSYTQKPAAMRELNRRINQGFAVRLFDMRTGEIIDEP